MYFMSNNYGSNRLLVPEAKEGLNKFKMEAANEVDLLAIFHVPKCVFLIFRDFQFSRHIPGPILGISHFSRFSLISSFLESSNRCFSFS